jgi:hypothetical protein
MLSIAIPNFFAASDHSLLLIAVTAFAVETFVSPDDILFNPSACPRADSWALFV